MDVYSVLITVAANVALLILTLIIIGAVSVLLITSGCSSVNIRSTVYRIYKKLTKQTSMAACKTHEDEEPYKQKLRTVVGMYFRFPSLAWTKTQVPTRIVDHLYIGGEMNATNLKQLRDIGITHVINCAQGYCQTGPSYYGNKVKYMGFEAEDDENYDIMQHHDAVYSFIEDARKSGGKAFMHCLMGVNRSGVLAISYLMVHKHMGPISATKTVKRVRQVVLTNNYFQEQLIHFANTKGLLLLDKEEL